MDPSYDKFVWKETTAGVWQRSVDEIEHFYFAVVKLFEGSGRMFFAITGHLSLEIDATQFESEEKAEAWFDEALRKTWLTLRFNHPTIASQVVQDVTTGDISKVYRTLLDADDRKRWLERTLVSISTGQTGVDWANSDPPAPELPTLFVVKPPSAWNETEKVLRRDLVLRSPHDVIDGVGTLLLFSNLVRCLSQALSDGDQHVPPALDGSETSNLSPPFRVAASVPATLSEAQQQRLESMTRQKATAAESPEGCTTLGLPFKRGAILPGKHQRVAVTLSKERTDVLLKACKAANATVTHAFHAAIAIVSLEVQKGEVNTPRARYVNYILRNDRSSCRSPYNTAEHAAALYHSVSGKALVAEMEVPATEEQWSSKVQSDFPQVLHTMKEFYEDVRNDAEHYALVPSIYIGSIPNVPISSAPPPVPPPKERATVSISSMGRVDSIIAADIGPVHANNPWVTGEELGNGLGLFLGTFKGELCLSAAYNDVWHSVEDSTDFLERCVDVVFRGLGISN